ncbi:putative disease resistance RPP13-like protein 1 isoform X2 [Euphorbia lathyris]
MKEIRVKNFVCALFKMLHDLVPRLRCLMVQSLAGYCIEELPSSIGSLKHLRYLNLSYTGLTKLPESISRLFNLQTLKLRGCQKLTELPRGLHNVGNIRDSEMVNLKEKQNIDSLTLEWTDSLNGVQNEQQVLASLHPHRNLGELSVKFYSGTKFPLWLGDPKFTQMKHLELKSCKIMSLPPLGQLPLLRKLSIEGMDGVKEVGVEFFGVGSPSSNAFPSLESLIITNMLEWEQWFCEEPRQVFPNLCELSMRNCPKLFGKLPKFLPSLKNLEICDCPCLTELPEILPSLTTMKVEKCQEMLLRNAHGLISLTTLEIRRISNLVSLHELLLPALVALEDLDIVDCHELMHLWPDESNIAKLASMRRLCIQECENLESLVEGREGILPCNLLVLITEKCRYTIKKSKLHMVSRSLLR